jgi:hypothetical protein
MELPLDKNVFFTKTLPSGRTTEQYIEAKSKSSKEWENEPTCIPACINIPTTGNMQLKDVPEFIKAIEIAVMIASEQLEIE